MAAKPRARKAPAKTSQSKAVMSFQEQMEAEAALLSKRVQAPSGNKIDTKDKRFTLPTGDSDVSIQVVVIDFINRNMFYTTKWNPKENSPPVCFAINRQLEAMTPSENAPEAQADDCVTCPMNQFGSDGDGKACKNSVRMAVMPVGQTDPDQMMILDVSPTAVKHFSAHVNSLIDKTTRKPMMPIQVVTEVTFAQDVTYSSLRFKSVGPNPTAEAQFQLRDHASALIEAEPDLSNYEAKPKRKGRK